MIVRRLWKRAQEQWGVVQSDLLRYLSEAGLPLSDAVLGRMLREGRRPRANAREIVRVLLEYFGQRHLLYSMEEVEELGRWFYLPPGTALGLMSGVKETNLDVTLIPQVFQVPEEVYGQVLKQLSRAHAPYAALEGAPGAGKTTVACHVGLNPLVGSWYDVVFYARLVGDAGLLSILSEFIWTLDPEQRNPANVTNAQATLRRLLLGKRALFILDDVAGGGIVAQLFVRLTDTVGGRVNGILITTASGVVLENADLHFGRVALQGWRSEQARAYVSALLDRRLSEEERRAVDKVNEWVEGLPLAWEVLADLLAYEADWPGFVDSLKDEGIEAARIRVVMARFLARLPTVEQRFFQVLGVFARRAPLDAPSAAYVSDLGEREARDVLRSLHRRHVMRHLGRDRYEMHAVLSHFAREKLKESGRFEELAERHARFYAQRAAPLLERQHEADWPDVVRQLLPDLPNFYRGQAWAAAKQHPLVMDYFLRLAPYFSAFREEERWQEWAEAAREVVKEAPSAFPAINRFSLYSQLGWGEGTFEQRLAYLQRAHEIATTETEPWVSVYSLTDLARLYLEPGQLAEAETALLEAWRVAQASEKPYLQAWTLREIGLYYARTLNREGCAVIADRLAEDVSQGLEGAYDAASRGEVLACAGRWAEALTAFREALAVYEAAGSRVQGSEMRLQVACCLAHLDREKEARDEIAAVEAHLDELPPEVVSLCRFVAGEAARLRGEHQTAVEHLSAALEPTGEEATFGWRVEFDVWLNLGQALQALGQEDKAENAFASAKVLAVNGHQPFWLWEVKRCHLIYERSPGPPSQLSELMSILHSE